MSPRDTIVIFDIDGTLLKTNHIDGACYRRALEELGITGFSTHWASYRYSTDTGILGEIYERHVGRAPSDAELLHIRIRFLELLKEAHRENPSHFEPVPGAPEAFAHFRSAGYGVAVATGCWRASARMKLHTAGINLDEVPAACADDHPERTELLKLAVARLYRTGSCPVAGTEADGAAGGTDTPSVRGIQTKRVVYFGDRGWDVRAARALGIGFVGVSADGTGEELRQAGARVILSDFSDLAALRDALEAGLNTT